MDFLFESILLMILVLLNIIFGVLVVSSNLLVLMVIFKFFVLRIVLNFFIVFFVVVDILVGVLMNLVYVFIFIVNVMENNYLLRVIEYWLWF